MGKNSQDYQYKKSREEFFSKPKNRLCQAKLPGCTCSSSEIHHKKGRGRYYLVVSTWIAVCRSCHTWITEHSKEAIIMGLSVSRLSENYEGNEEDQIFTSYTGVVVDFDESS